MLEPLPEQPNLDGRRAQGQSQVVFCKIVKAAELVPTLLGLAVSEDIFRMILPVLAAVVGIAPPPFLHTLQTLLAVVRIGVIPVAVVIAFTLGAARL
jgi:hypothetical protein